MGLFLKPVRRDYANAGLDLSEVSLAEHLLHISATRLRLPRVESLRVIVGTCVL